jgi:hypothetical protein
MSKSFRVSTILLIFSKVLRFSGSKVNSGRTYLKYLELRFPELLENCLAQRMRSFVVGLLDVRT